MLEEDKKRKQTNDMVVGEIFEYADSGDPMATVHTGALP
jgi:hypothetical protein